MESVEILKILDRFDKMEKFITDMMHHKETQISLTSKLNAIYDAFAKAKLEYKTVRFNRTNTFNNRCMQT